MRSDKDQLEELYARLCAASIEKNATGIRETLAPDYALVHMTGMRQGREEYIESVLNGTLNYFESICYSIDVAVSEDGLEAEICGRSRTSAAVFGGSPHVWRLQQDLRAEKREGKWKFTESRASTY